MSELSKLKKSHIATRVIVIIVIVIIVGLSYMYVYNIIFKTTVDNTNLVVKTNQGNYNSNINNNTNTSNRIPEVILVNGNVPNACQTNSDCTIINSTLDFSNCCVVDYCPDYSDDKYVGINKTSYDNYKQSAEALIDCGPASCELMPIPLCVGGNNDQYSAECVNNECQKVFAWEEIDTSN